MFEKVKKIGEEKAILNFKTRIYYFLISITYKFIVYLCIFVIFQDIWVGTFC